MLSQGLLKNFSWNMFGSFIYAITQWLLIVGLNRLGDLEMVGLYSLGLALGAPIMLFLNFKLRTIQSTKYGEKYQYNDFFSLRFLTNLIFLFLIHLVAFIYMENMTAFIIIILVGYMKILESFFDVGYGLFQRNERLEIVAKSFIMRGVFGTLVFLLTLYLFESIFSSLVSLCVVWLIIYFVFDLKKIKHLGENQKLVKGNLKEIFKIGLPLGIVALFGSLSLNFPRVVIENTISIEALGVFSSIIYLNLILGKFVLSIGQAILPRLSKLYSNLDIKSYLKLFITFNGLLILFSMALIIGSLLKGEEILVIIYGLEYQGYSLLLVLTMIYGLFYYLSVAFQIGLDSLGSFKVQVPIVIVNIILIIIMSLILIPLYGMFGAFYALIFSSVVQLVIYIILFVKKVRK